MKRIQSIGFLLSVVTAVLVLLLVSVFANSARQAFVRRQAAAQLLSAAHMVRDIYALIELLHVEDGRVRTALSAPAPAHDAVRARLVTLHGEDEKALDRTLRELAPAEAARLARARAGYDTLFAQAAAALSQPKEARAARLRAQWGDTINDVVRGLQKPADIRSTAITRADSFNNEMMKILHIVQALRRVAGIGRRMVGEAITSGERPSPAMLHDLAEQDGRFLEPWAVLQGDAASPDLPQAMRAALASAQKSYIGETRGQRDRIMAQLAAGIPPMSGESWMQISDSGLGALARISDTALVLTQEHVAEQVQVADREFSLALLLMLVSISLASLTAIVVNLRVIMPLRSMVRTMAAVSAGDLGHAVPFTGRADEIGEFARALCLFRDNTLEKQYLEEELRHVQVARETAEASSRIKSEFLANMSHELRTPLNAILGFSDLMKAEVLGPLARQYREYAALIHESGEHLLNLVSDLLDIAKIEAGKFVLSVEPMELLEAVNYCTRLVQRRAREEGVVLSVEMPAAPVHFSADPRGFRQILINLLSNAIKFTRKGGQVTVSAAVVDGRLRILVSDSGIGMSQSLLARIGRPFEQASNDPAHAREGTGLGLSLVRAIVAQHGGTLAIDSRENVGTRVTVLLPLLQQARAAA